MTNAIGFTFASLRFWLKPKSRDCPPTRRAGVSRLARQGSTALQARDALNPIAHFGFSPIPFRVAPSAPLRRETLSRSVASHMGQTVPFTSQTSSPFQGEARWGFFLQVP